MFILPKLNKKMHKEIPAENGNFPFSAGEFKKSYFVCCSLEEAEELFFLSKYLITNTKPAKRSKAVAHMIKPLQTPPKPTHAPATTYEIAAIAATTEA